MVMTSKCSSLTEERAAVMYGSPSSTSRCEGRTYSVKGEGRGGHCQGVACGHTLLGFSILFYSWAHALGGVHFLKSTLWCLFLFISRSQSIPIGICLQCYLLRYR